MSTIYCENCSAHLANNASSIYIISDTKKKGYSTSAKPHVY